MINNFNIINKISIIIPVYNEEKNISFLVKEIKKSLDDFIKFEIVIIDDGSTDSTKIELKKLINKYNNVKVLKHKQNYGQSISIRTGILNANEEYILTMDGDGQNDPRDIKKLIKKYAIGNEFHLVIGNRIKRHDSLAKKIASRLAFFIRRFILGDTTPDTGCAMKIFKKEDFLLLPFFNHIHRFFPVLFRNYGGTVVSIPVNHRKRMTGNSKYTNLQRGLVGIYDLIGVVWLTKRSYIPKFVKEKKKSK